MENNKIINGCVYKDQNTLYLVNFYTEKKHKITDSIYSTCCGGKPLGQNTIMLVYWELLTGDRYKTYPIVDFELTKNGNPAPVGKYDMDVVISCSYKAATAFLAKKKVKHSSP